MVIFNGKKESGKILSDVGKKIRKERLSPRLAAILVGDNPSSKLYVDIKKKAGKKVGINVLGYNFKDNAGEENVMARIRSLNADKSINGIIVQLPLPDGFNAERVVGAIDPKKDVDGFHEENRRLLKKGNPYFLPALPLAIYTAFLQSPKRFRGKKILAFVNSEIFGRSLEDFFKLHKLILKYILKKKAFSLKIRQEAKKAGVIITVCGCPNLIKGDMIKKGTVLIDAGIKRLKTGKVSGDVNRESVAEKASFLTPATGGIGPLTVALLLKNTYLSAKKYGRS